MPWRRFAQFRLRTLLITITMLAVVGGGGLALWRMPFEDERWTTVPTWQHHSDVEMVLLIALADARRTNADETRIGYLKTNQEWLAALKANTRYRQMFRAYRNLRGETVLHGELTEWRLDRRLRREHWRHGLRHGNFIDYFPSGEVLATGQYRFGKPVGQWVKYLDALDGAERSRQIEVYREGELQRRERVYAASTDGSLELFRDGRKFLQINSSGGKKTSETHFRDGRKHGTATEWHRRSDRKLVEAHYVDGVLEGPWRSWHENGRSCADGQMIGNRPHGTWTAWAADGTLVGRVEFAADHAGDRGDAEIAPISIPDFMAADHRAMFTEALTRPVSVRFRQEPLEDTIEWMEQIVELPILINWRAIAMKEPAGASSMTVDFEGVTSFEHFVYIACQQVDLVPVIRHEWLMLTTPEDARQWRDESGIPELLAASSPYAGTMQLEALMDFGGTPLNDVVAYVAKLYHLRIEIDEASWGDAASATEVSVDCRARRMSLGAALSYLADQHQLVYVAANGGLQVRARRPSP